MAASATWQCWQRPAVVPLAESLRRRTVTDRGLSDQAAASLRMVNRRGQYADRTVTFVRVADPEAVRRAGLALCGFGDLDAHQVLQLPTGHVERDGQIVLHRS
jgi:hypothetical protein